jgi:hypothetical protein
MYLAREWYMMQLLGSHTYRCLLTMLSLFNRARRLRDGETWSLWEV